MKQEKHLTKKWEVSLIELENGLGKKFKVTKRLPELSIAETKIFRTKAKANKQVEEWLK